MSFDDDLVSESAEDLYENAPCGYLSTRLDGAIVRVNRTFEALTGRTREALLAGTRFQDLLSAGGRIYHETHYVPLLRMQGSIREIAVEFVRADGSLLPALVNSVLWSDAGGQPQLIRTTVFDASDRRRYERELLKARRDQHEIALELQRGLLSKELPTVAGLELDVAYRPGKSGTDVGGDWYDVFEADGDVVFVVGDVVGHGIGAAAEMGQLRSALRAFMATGLGPAQALTALDDFSERHGVGQLATLVCAELDQEAGLLRYACAGHLPPLLLRPGQRPAFLWEARSQPLATPLTGQWTRQQAQLQLQAGDTLIFYTDGLVERRDAGVDPGLNLLLAEAAKHANEVPAVLAGELIRALRDDDHLDDVCLLVARLAST